MAVVAEVSTSSYTRNARLSSSKLALPSTNLSYLRRHAFRPITRHRNATISSPVNQVQALIAVQPEDTKSKSDCCCVFCLTYDLKAEEETKCWKKLINISVSGAAGMISNHLLFKLASGEVFGPDQPIDQKGHFGLLKTEADLLAEKRCVAHVTGDGVAFCDLPEDTMLPGEM